MSHIVEIKTEVKSEAAVQAACRRLELPPPVHETVRLFSDTATGYAVRLPNWRYPVVCDLTSGSLRFDTFEGAWGESRHLDAFLQAYAVEQAKLEARRQGHSASETRLADGSIRLTISLGGAA